jgi:hypothetical protein
MMCPSKTYLSVLTAVLLIMTTAVIVREASAATEEFFDTNCLKEKLAPGCPTCCYAMLPMACYLSCDALCGSRYFELVDAFKKTRSCNG